MYFLLELVNLFLARTVFFYAGFEVRELEKFLCLSVNYLYK